MPVFYTCACDEQGGPPASSMMIEADGKLIEPTFHGLNVVPSDWMGCPDRIVWTVDSKGSASSGVAEFTPGDDRDNLLFWKVEAGKVLLRVQNRVVVLDVSHINQPDSPSSSGEGGEE